MSNDDYSILLKFNEDRLDVMFMAEKDGMQEKFIEARKGLTPIGDSCETSREFFKKAIDHFRSYGFYRIKR